MIVVTICATKSYTYAMHAQAERVLANLNSVFMHKSRVVLVGDNSAEIQKVKEKYHSLGLDVELVSLDDAQEGGENYKDKAQLLIARMRSAAFSRARQLKAMYCWSLDSDTLPPHNALRCMMNSLEFDAGYYSVATCPYPNTAFLGGFGTPMNPIAEDFLPNERKLTDELKKELEANDAELKSYQESKKPIPDDVRERWNATNKKIKECPPDGNIWEVTAKYGWRRRGWLDNAYPAIGKGAMVPSDWCGFGCTLMNREALSLAYFDGYDGKGTEDLFICWHRWHPAGLRLNVIPHCPCDHVIWAKKKGGDEKVYTLHQSYHEQMGEHRGHLRVRQVPWVPELG